MNTPAPLELHRTTIRARWFMVIAWALILTKCAVVAWAVDRWHMPFNAAWVVVPTLAFAALATLLWCTHRE